MPGSVPKKMLVKNTFNLADAESHAAEQNTLLWVQSLLTLYKNIYTADLRNGTTILNSMDGGNNKWVGLAGQYQAYAPTRRMYDAIVDINGTPGVDCDYDDIQDAVDDGCKTIFIRKGVYTYGGNFTLDTKNNVSLIGEDRDLTIIQGDDDCDYAMYVIGCNNLRVENLTFTFTGLTGDRLTITYWEGNCSDVRIWNCRFKGDSPNGTDGYIERGIWAEGSNKYRWNITECVFEQLDYSGITVYGASMENFLITYNKFLNCNGNFGIDTYIGCHYFLVAFNHFENLKAPVGSISGALFFNGGGIGSQVNWNHSVICNVFKDCPLGIQFDHNCHDILVQGNQFHNGQVHIRFCGSDNTGHHVSNNFNRNGGTLNIELDWATLDATAVFYIGGNWEDMPWRIVGTPNNPAYKGAWGAYGTSGGAKFVMSDTHEVILGGQVSGGVIASPIFNLPAGWRPPYDMTFTVGSNNGGAFIFGMISIQAVTGAVMADIGSNVLMSLDGIRFRVNNV